MQGFGGRGWIASILLFSMLAITGCASKRLPAPVEDRGTMSRAPSSAPVSNAPDAAKPLPGIENQGKPGYYTVRPGDTIMRIGMETGQNWRDIVRWNSLENANLIEVGQVLRVVPPVTSAGTSGTAAAPSETGVVTRPVTQSTLPPVPTVPANAALPPQAAASQPARATPPVATASVTPAASGSGDEDVGWIWPAQGSLLAGFDEAKNKGYDIGGKQGDPVLAAADGRVVYAGAGLRGYGNLIILKHNNTFLTAYAHNHTLLVKEDQSVQKGQKIAEMGSSDADRVKLHFEIRRQGKPVDPSRYLPSR
ncbi:MAG: LysM peptidoglycan-binding domain-containing protein [Comamonadaceae bacterium]|nr:MAG: LysM peptidoglycan-binding domain-containing protein [Comamonadaceae bacterium]